LAAKVGINS